MGGRGEAVVRKKVVSVEVCFMCWVGRRRAGGGCCGFYRIGAGCGLEDVIFRARLRMGSRGGVGWVVVGEGILGKMGGVRTHNVV